VVLLDLGFEVRKINRPYYEQCCLSINLHSVKGGRELAKILQGLNAWRVWLSMALAQTWSCISVQFSKVVLLRVQRLLLFGMGLAFSCPYLEQP
jgi:hypothetical protein